MDKVRIGIIGAGWVAQNRHLPALAQIPDVELGAIWSRSADRAREVAAKFGIARCAADWRDITDAPDLDAVVVATPPVLHLPATVRALDARKHVLCQARFARNGREARAMVEAARNSDRVTATYPPRPGLKGDRVMRRLIHDGEFVGTVREVRVTGLSLEPKREAYSWQADPAVFGVNTMSLAMWVEVANRWVGPAVRVAAIARTHRPERVTAGGTPAPAAVPDSIAVTAELASGATASYHLGTCAAFGPGASLEVFGERGALQYRFFAEEILGATAGEEKLRPIPIAPGEERAQTTDAEFVAAIRTGAPVSPTFEEGLRYMEFCDAAAVAAKTGRTVPVPCETEIDSWESTVERGAAQ
jgi:predicted dehydrogenase